jgi:monoamine oxidase
MKFARKWALSALFTFCIAPLTWAANTTHDVVIVGAGSAGLYAAKTLNEDGYNVLIIEATDRYGGRVYSYTMNNTRIDLGAEEHYGSTGSNPVWPAIQGQYGTSIYVDGYQGIGAYSMDDGTNTCWTMSGATRNCADDPDVKLVDDLYRWYWHPSRHKDPTTTLADDVLKKYGVAPGDRSYHIYESSFAGGSYATSLHKLGARSLALQDNEWDLSEGIVVIGDKDLGYSDALETVWWNDVVANSDLLLESPVVRIDTSGDDVIVTAGGDLHAARQVIVTVSIGVLQNEMIDFVPNLPASTIDAYNGIGIDMGMKVPIRFSSAWWELEGEPLSWLVTEGLAAACWIPTDYKVGSTDHIMMCYPMGDNAVMLNEIAEDAGGGVAGDAAIVEAILDDLDMTFPEAPGAATANAIEAVVQNWGAHPYTLGVYSYPRVGTFTTASDNKRADLQVPVANNRIFFAGEGSHVTHPATVVGALHEGERAANNVDAVNGNPNNLPPLPGGGNIPPTADIAVSCTGLTCNFNGSGSNDPDGNITSYDWDFDDGNSGSGTSPNHTYAMGGTYNVTLTVTDDDTDTGNDNASVTVTSSTDPTTMSVASILAKVIGEGGGNKRPRATVSIVDDQGNPVGSATVTGTFTGDAADPSETAGITNGSGTAVLNSDDSKKGRVKFTFCVTDVEHATLTYQSVDNAVDCASN